MEVVNNIIERLRKYATYYWVLVTMAAFLLAALVGPPSLFKAVYMFGFVLSLLIYQVCVCVCVRVCVCVCVCMRTYAHGVCVFQVAQYACLVCAVPPSS